jgi:Ulp1 family protease
MHSYLLTKLLSLLLIQPYFNLGDKDAEGLILKNFKSNIQKNRFIVIPIHAGTGAGGHWTLLSFDTETGEFEHYNSLLPKGERSIGHESNENAEKMANFIFKNCLKEIETQSSQSSTPKGLVHHLDDCLQQMPGSNDCGICVVLYVLMIAIEGKNTILEDPIAQCNRMRRTLYTRILNSINAQPTAKRLL